MYVVIIVTDFNFIIKYEGKKFSLHFHLFLHWEVVKKWTFVDKRKCLHFFPPFTTTRDTFNDF